MALVLMEQSLLPGGGFLMSSEPSVIGPPPSCWTLYYITHQCWMTQSYYMENSCLSEHTEALRQVCGKYKSVNSERTNSDCENKKC